MNLLAEAKSYCESGIGKDPSNEELKKLAKQIYLKKLEQEQREAQVSRALVEAKVSTFGLCKILFLELKKKEREEALYLIAFCLIRTSFLSLKIEG